MNKIKLILLIIVTGILLAACQPDESGKLENRVKAYWQHKINKEFDKAYEYTTPGYKKLTSKEVYAVNKGLSKLVWEGIEIEKKECEKQDLCKVHLKGKYKYKMSLGMAGAKDIEVETPMTETWIMQDNTWYIVQK